MDDISRGIATAASHCNPGAKHRTPLTERISRACNRRMNPRRSDDELWSVLDDPGLWLVYGGGVLAEETTLREALHRAHDLSARGSPLKRNRQNNRQRD
jgi:hypothetical protein